jgi:hypothetical protein
MITTACDNTVISHYTPAIASGMEGGGALFAIAPKSVSKHLKRDRVLSKWTPPPEPLSEH